MRVFSFILFLFIIACQNSDKKTTTVVHSDSVAPLTEAQKAEAAAKLAAIQDSILVAAAKKILLLIQQKDYLALATTFHPEGVRFSMYGYVDSTADLVIKGADFSQNLKKKRKWGSSYGDEVPILKNTSDYFKRYVYDVDFMSVTNPSCNESVASGSSGNNMAESYKGCDYVEFHKEGTNPKYEGMDWRTLRIVLKKTDSGFQLVGIVHNEWTP